MASFGISCCLPTRRRNQIAHDDFKKTISSTSCSDTIDDLSLLMTPPSQKKVRRAPLSNLPTLASCGLGDPYFFGRPKWPRANRKRFGLPVAPQAEDAGVPSSESTPRQQPLPAVRATRFGLTYPDRDVFEKTQRADMELNHRIRNMRFPSLNMLKPTRIERREPPMETSGGQIVNPDRRQVVLPKSFRSNMVTDMRNRQLFTDFPPLEIRSVSPSQSMLETAFESAGSG
eukprot:TRINITY_DN19727_c0_g1_i1.p3 TRINITY_DN19727_c0_g1~~TRINITY_DN19727_c0_g1_i1.p3  ORF type:complete len:230 (+),score=53.98 TRINITY_DN19727_c0_g1_i1:82-771(+)